MKRVAYQSRTQSVTIHITVVGQDSWHANRQQRIFQRRITIVVGDGRVVHGPVAEIFVVVKLMVAGEKGRIAHHGSSKVNGARPAAR